MYAALTPSAIMAGGRFEAAYTSGIVAASFTTGLDFIVSWLPFYYDARFYISIAARIDLLFTINATIGASLHIWGPDFAGKATVDLSVYSFSLFDKQYECDNGICE